MSEQAEADAAEADAPVSLPAEPTAVELESPFAKGSPIWQKPKNAEPTGPDNVPPAVKFALDYLWVGFALIALASYVSNLAHGL